ncbi:unnamed protein product [Lampetra planeri]
MTLNAAEKLRECRRGDESSRAVLEEDSFTQPGAARRQRSACQREAQRQAHGTTGPLLLLLLLLLLISYQLRTAPLGEPPLASSLNSRRQEREGKHIHDSN